MADRDDTRSFDQIKAYPRGSAQGGRAIQAVKGNMTDKDGASGHRTVIRETAEGRAIGRTRDNMPMVEVDKQSVELGMDSGVVDMLSAAPLNPELYKDGILKYTDKVAAHIASAVPGDPDRPIVDEIAPPESIKGVPPGDSNPAKSFRATKAEQRENLAFKKLTAQNCPPSIFTGRTRLWVQALYGRHDALTLLKPASVSIASTPALRVGTLDPVTISTSCGVFYEASTGKHWLISVHYDYADIYPLSASDEVEELRSYLTDPEFPDDDKERVEAYILSDSLPVPTKGQRLTFEAQHAWSMGYGWHFNWSGDKCDLVYNEIVDADGYGDENQSTHYRLTFAKNAEDNFSVTKTTVEGPVRWKNYHHGHPITFPNWEVYGLEKFGANAGPAVHGNAPFYAFYQRDILQVCRYSAQTTTTDKGGTRSPDYLNIATNQTIGGDALDYTVWESWSGVEVAISCGADSISFKSGNRYGFSRQRSSPAITSVTGWHPVFYVAGDATLSGIDGGHPTSFTEVETTDYYLGTINVLNSAGGKTGLTYATSTIGPGGYKYSVGIRSAITSKSIDRTDAFSTAFICAIPFNDAEAIYLLGSQTKYTTDSVVETSGEADGFFEILATESGGWLYVAETVSDGGPIPETVVFSTHTDVHDPETTTVSKLICSAGVINGVAFPAPSSFFSPEVDVVSQTYDTRTSASGTAVRAPNNGVTQGTPDPGDPFVFVGWA